MAHYVLLYSRQTRIIIDMAARGLCHVNVNMCCSWLFAETTDAVVFVWRTVSVLHI